MRFYTTLARSYRPKCSRPSCRGWKIKTLQSEQIMHVIFSRSRRLTMSKGVRSSVKRGEESVIVKRSGRVYVTYYGTTKWGFKTPFVSLIIQVYVPQKFQDMKFGDPMSAYRGSLQDSKRTVITEEVVYIFDHIENNLNYFRNFVNSNGTSDSKRTEGHGTPMQTPGRTASPPLCINTRRVSPFSSTINIL